MGRATEKDLEKCLRLMTKWNQSLGWAGWAIAGKLCGCDKPNVQAHLDIRDRAHVASLHLHDSDDLKKTALHEVLHLLTSEMSAVIWELQSGEVTERQRLKALEWYEYYEDRFIDHFVGIILGYDKEIRSLKRKIKKLEKQQ